MQYAQHSAEIERLKYDVGELRGIPVAMAKLDGKLDAIVAKMDLVVAAISTKADVSRVDALAARVESLANTGKWGVEKLLLPVLLMFLQTAISVVVAYVVAKR